jgi:hypothetical protein
MSSVAEKLQKKAKRPVGTRQVRLRLVYVDFWSMVKLSFLIALAGSIVIVVATALVWVILNQTGVFTQIDALLKDVTGQNSYSIMDQFSLGQVLGFSINVVVGTVLGAIVSVLYNLSVRITGGLLVGFTNN